MSRNATTPLAVAGAALAPGGLRTALVAFGWANVAAGLVGIFVPGLPTTVFLLIALWAFSRSSPRFNAWLVNHPRFGPLLRDWRTDRVVPVRAKCLALGMMAISLGVATVLADGWVLPAALAAVLAAVAAFLLTRPSRPVR